MTRKKLKKKFLSIPVHDNDTRWNTSYAMIESLLKVRGFVEDEDDLLELFCEDDLGDMLGTWLECKIELKKVGSPLADQIVEAMTKRERREVFAQSNRQRAGQDKVPPLFEYPGFLASIFLDPRYFTILNEEEIMTAKIHISQLWAKIEKNKNLGSQQISSDSNPDGGEDPEDELEAILSAGDGARLQNSLAPSTDIASKLNIYFRSTPCKRGHFSSDQW